MKRSLLLLLLAATLSAQTPVHRHRHSLISPAGIKSAAVKVHHALRVTGEAALGAAIVVVWIYASGH